MYNKKLIGTTETNRNYRVSRNRDYSMNNIIQNKDFKNDCMKYYVKFLQVISLIDVQISIAVPVI